MRLTMECDRTPAGQLHGTVAVDTGGPVTFSGTLELLKVLQDLTGGDEIGTGPLVSPQ